MKYRNRQEWAKMSFSVLFHLKFNAMKFFTVRAQGFPGKCLAETTDMFQVEKLRFVHVCTGFFFNKSIYPNNKHRCLEIQRFLGTVYLQDMCFDADHEFSSKNALKPIHQSPESEWFEMD